MEQVNMWKRGPMSHNRLENITSNSLLLFLSDLFYILTEGLMWNKEIILFVNMCRIKHFTNLQYKTTANLMVVSCSSGALIYLYCCESIGVYCLNTGRIFLTLIVHCRRGELTPINKGGWPSCTLPHVSQHSRNLHEALSLEEF